MRSDDAVVLYPPLSGTPLHEELRCPGQEIGRWLEVAGQAMSVLHNAPQAFPGLLKFHSVEAEMGEVVDKSLIGLLPARRTPSQRASTTPATKSSSLNSGAFSVRERRVNTRKKHGPNRVEAMCTGEMSVRIPPCRSRTISRWRV